MKLAFYINNNTSVKFKQKKIQYSSKIDNGSAKFILNYRY